VDMRRASLAGRVSLAQGLYYITPGLWALLARERYKRAHGLRSDDWVLHAHTMWLLLVGGALVVAGYRRQVSPEARLLGVGAAAGLQLVTALTARTGRLTSRIYYGDLPGELALLTLWAVAWRRERQCSRASEVGPTA
jgi:hypothetical protein